MNSARHCPPCDTPAHGGGNLARPMSTRTGLFLSECHLVLLSPATLTPTDSGQAESSSISEA